MGGGEEGGVAVEAGNSVFWDDLARDLEDPEFDREYLAQSIRIATIDRIVNELDDARQQAGLSKTELARAINSEPATVRRLFPAGHVSPTLGTLAEVAVVLGMQVVLAPMDEGAQDQIATPLRQGKPRGTWRAEEHQVGTPDSHVRHPHTPIDSSVTRAGHPADNG